LIKYLKINEIYEYSEHFKKVMELIEVILSYFITTEYTKEEYDIAEWYTVRSKWNPGRLPTA
jgi:hypothetical protein